MPYPPQVYATTGHAFGLTVSGVQIVDKVPTDLAPIRWDWPSSTNSGGISFTVEDEGETALVGGMVIRLTDNVANELLWSGPLVNVRNSRGPGPSRRADVGGVGWGFFLDNRAVDDWSYTGTYMTPAIDDLMALYGGPVRFWPPGILLGSVGTTVSVQKSTVRGALDAIGAEWSSTNSVPQYYVDNERRLHAYVAGSTESGPSGNYDTGTATSVGDLAALTPEFLTYEVGSEGYKNFGYVYDTAGDFQTVGGWGGNSAHTPWESGQPSVIIDSIYDWGNWGAAAQYELVPFHSDVASITFTTIEDSTFRPGMKITVTDSIITGGSSVVFYISDVSGTIDARNVIEVNVSIGARARSLVQTVAGG